MVERMTRWQKLGGFKSRPEGCDGNSSRSSLWKGSEDGLRYSRGISEEWERQVYGCRAATALAH